MIKNIKKSISIFSTIILCTFIISFFNACSFFEDDIKEDKKSEQQMETSEISHETSPEESLPQANNTFTLIVTPKFQRDNQQNNRSAYPDFNKDNLKNYVYLISCSEFSETQGTFAEDAGTITFTINSLAFSTEKDISIFAAKLNAENELQKLWIAKTKITYALGDTKEISVNFVPYTEDEGNTEELPNGAIDLIVETTSGYSVSCVIESTGSTPEQVSGYGKPVQVSSVQTNKCTIKTGTNGIAQGSYTAKIQIKKNGELRDYIIQTIVVWPGITTDTWYLPDGNKSNTYTVTISENEKRIYVCGSNPKGLYNITDGLASYMTISPSDTNSGSITQPCASISTAITKTLNNSGNKYTIICDGDLAGFTLNSTSGYNLRDITIKGGGNSNNYSSITSKITLYTQANIILENLKFSNLSDSYSIQGNFYDSKELILNNCIIENNASSHTGILCASKANEKVPKLQLNDTKITCTSGTALQFDTDSSTQSELTIKGSTYIQPTSDSKNQMEVYALTKMIIDGALTDSNQILGSIKFLSDIAVDTQFMTAENSANLAIESQRFEVIDYPKIINTEGKIAYAKDFYVASDTSTPAGSSYGNGSSKNPLNKVSAAVAKIKTVANTENCAGEYTIHVSGTINESSIITVSAGTDTDTLGVFTGSKLKITGTDKTTDILDASGGSDHIVLGISKVDVTFENITIQKGRGDSGAGIKIETDSVVKLGSGVVITKNRATYNGGGIYNEGTLFMYGDSIIGAEVTEAPANDTTCINNGGNTTVMNINEYGGAGLYNAGGTVYLGYTDFDIPDTSEDTCKISGNYSGRNGGGIIVAGGALYIKKVNIINNKTSYAGGGIEVIGGASIEINGGTIQGNDASTGGGMYIKGDSSVTMSDGNIKANNAYGEGGGVCLTATGNNTFIMSGGKIEQNTVTAGQQGGGIWTRGNLKLKNEAYIPAGSDGKNDIFLDLNAKITIADNLTPPTEASGITATITPYTYNTTNVYLIDESDGSLVTANYDKFKVTPDGSTNWKLKTDGTICVPFTVYVNNDLYTDKFSLDEALGNYTYREIEIEIRVLEAGPDDFGPANAAAGNYNILKSIKNAISATRINLIVDENANIKLPEDSSNYFKSCKKLYHVDLRGLDTSDVKNMSSMFSNICDDVHSWNGVLDIRNFDTRKVTNMSSMFGYCSYLKTIIIGDNFSLAETQGQMTNMFNSDYALVGGQGTEYDGNDYPSIDGGSGDPGYFTSVDQLPIQVTPENLSTIFQSNWTGTKQFQITGTLDDDYRTAIAAAIKALNGTNKYVDIDFSTIDNTNYPMAPDCSDCQNITKLTFMGGGSLETIPRGAMYLGSNTFKNCTSLTTVKVISQLTSNLEADPSTEDLECDIRFAFDGCTALEELDLTECLIIHIHGPFLANNGGNSTLKSIKYGPASKGSRTVLLSQTNRFNQDDFKIHYIANSTSWEEPLTYGENSLQKENLTVYFDLDGTTKVYDGAGTWN